MTPPRRPVAALGALVAALIAGGLPVGGAPLARVAAAPAPLTLVSQALDVAFGAPLELVVTAPPDIDLAAPDTSVIVTAYDRVTTRDALHRAFDGTFGRAVDSVDIAAALVPRDPDGNLALSIPTETNTRTSVPLQLPRVGVYPIVVDIRRGDENLAELITFARRLANPTGDDADVSGSLQVALVMSATSPVTLDDQLMTRPSDEATAELARLDGALAAAAFPAAVQIPPRLLDLLGDPARAQLANSVQPHLVLAAPRLPLDPSLAMQDGQQDVANQWLRDGEDLLRDRLGAVADRSVHIVTTPLSLAGASLLRDQGVRMLVMSRDIYDQLPDKIPDFEFPQLTGVHLQDGSRLDLAVPDPRLSAMLDDPVGGPALTAVRAAAELVTLRQELIGVGVRPERSGVILARSDLGVPDPATIAAVTAMIGTTAGLTGVGIDDVSERVDRLLFDGQEILAGLPTTVAGSLQPRVELATALTQEALEAYSMLPADSNELLRWSAYTSIFTTSALTDGQLARAATSLRDEFREIRTALEMPQSSKFNLTGRRTTLKFRFRNNLPVPVNVVLLLDSTKFDFPDNGVTEQIPPGAHEVEVTVIAKSNGTIPLTLRVVTPYDQSLLSPPIPLTANVNAVSGLGNLATGALLLLVLLWWFRHWRATVRKRRAAPSLQRHPASITDDAETTVSTVTAPGEPTTLPSS